jgi:hypothetical protein
MKHFRPLHSHGLALSMLPWCRYRRRLRDIVDSVPSAPHSIASSTVFEDWCDDMWKSAVRDMERHTQMRSKVNQNRAVNHDLGGN